MHEKGNRNYFVSNRNYNGSNKSGFKVNEQMSVAKSVSVIGGADGPTSIFVAGKIGGTPAIIGIIVGIVLLAIGIFIFARKK